MISKTSSSALELSLEKSRSGVDQQLERDAAGGAEVATWVNHGQERPSTKPPYKVQQSRPRGIPVQNSKSECDELPLLPTRVGNKRILKPVRLNSTEVSFMLDTGADVSLVTERMWRGFPREVPFRRCSS